MAASSSVLQNALYSANESVGNTAATPLSVLQGALYSDVQNPQSPSSFLGNIGGEVESFAHDSSGLAGAFLPGLAQQMVNNPTPVVQNQLQMSMAYPPALLQKMMMASGGIPSEALAQGAVGVGQRPSLKTIPAALGQYGQSLLKSVPSLANNAINSILPLPVASELDQGAVKDYRNLISPIENYNVNKGLNVPNTPLNNMTEAGIRQAIPIAGLAMGAGSGSAGLDSEISSVPEMKTGLENLSPTLKNIVKARRISEAVEDRMYNSKNVYNSSPMDYSEASMEGKSTNLLPKTMNIGGKSVDTDELKAVNPNLYNQLLDTSKYSGNLQSPIRAMFHPDDLDSMMKAGGTKLRDAFDLQDKSDTIENAHDLSKLLNKNGASQTNDPLLRNTFFKASQRIRDEAIKPTIFKNDEANELNPLDANSPYSLYSKADDYHSNVVLPFEANNEVAKMSHGSAIGLTKPRAFSAITRGQEDLRDWQRNPITGDKKPLIGNDHFLAQVAQKIKPGMMQKYGKKAIGVGLTAAGLDWFKHFMQ